MKAAPENTGTKPRINLSTLRPGQYLCRGHGAYGYGGTPTRAYIDWEASRRYILGTPHRNMPPLRPPGLYCLHSETKPGARYPLRYGSAATEECQTCGAYRMVGHGISEWEDGPLSLKIAAAQKLKDEEC